jgi:signal transduction histidine kinase
LAAGLAHEIGNPISVVQGYLGLLSQTDLNDGERKEFALRSEKELARIDQLVRQLLDYSRVNTGEQSEVSMHDLLDAMVAMLRSQPSMRDISFQFSFAAAEDTVLADPNQVQQVLLNCFFNAADALHVESSSSKLIKIETENIVDEDGSKKIRISLQDNGTGMNEDILANVFDPFFTTKEPGKGTGLGLSVAHSLIEGMGGTMRLESKSGAGTVVIFVLPLL